MKVAESFDASVKEFIDAAAWLGPEHQPALVTLVAIAQTLDAGDRTPALLGQFGLAFRSLAKLAPPANSSEVDPVDDLIEAARAR